jgi:Zn-dependent peptidase ImmA (M78 family)
LVAKKPEYYQIDWYNNWGKTTMMATTQKVVSLLGAGEMYWTDDASGRFDTRPKYTPTELELFSQQHIARSRLRLNPDRPITTFELITLVEQNVAYLDLYSDLSKDGSDIECAIDYFSYQKPIVRVKRELAVTARLESRLRIVLAHELIHAVLHSEVMGHIKPESICGFRTIGPRCNIETIYTADINDWLEWQATYAGGSLLMPAQEIAKFIGPASSVGDLAAANGNLAGDEPFIDRLAAYFLVPREFVTLRLHQLSENALLPTQ